MADRAAERQTAQEAEDYLAAAEARQAREVERADAAAVRRFRGPCDVCGSQIEVTLVLGYIDIFITDDDRVGSWVRHYATAPPGADPDCARYSSRVYEYQEIQP
jgi:hypothetical protein